MYFQRGICTFFGVILILLCYITNGYSNSTPLKEFLLYSTRHYIKGHELNSTSDNSTSSIPPIFSRKAIFTAVDFDFQNDHIYYLDTGRNFIYRVNTNGTGQQIVTTSQHDGTQGLAVDWMANNLYYFDVDNKNKSKLNVLSSRNFANRKVLLKDLKKPVGLVIHPNRGLIFISEWQKPASISKISTDGTNLVVLSKLTKLGYPLGLAIDFVTDRLYWSDGTLARIQHSNLDGSDVETTYSIFFDGVYSLAVYQDSMYCSQGGSNWIFRTQKLKKNFDEISTIADEGDETPYGVKVYSQNQQLINKNHPCLSSNNYGGCQKLCFGVPSKTSTELQVKCGCPYGEKLADDERTCIPDPSVKVELTTTGCSNSSDIKCNSQHCIPRSFVCDGENDCGDNSDETGCAKVDRNPELDFQLPKLISALSGEIQKIWKNSKSHLHTDWMYITDWKLNSIIKSHKLHGNMEEIVTKELQDSKVNVVKVYSQSEQDIGKSHPCLRSNNYGGCQKLCFGVPSNLSTELQVKCGCPYGEKLADDERNCIPDPSAEPAITVCPDSLDFVCNNQHCLSESLRCDGEDDCGDNGDEISCDDVTTMKNL